ncbi:methyl-accepting chemotaxis protein [Bacterioplanoides sp.]|uniref:methyl-accepting chemotaxis protein n=1 Tax=Bacterioplanoides sp. TaxID=2066072 RepID=UPI003AFFF597
MDWLRTFSIRSRLWFLLATSISCILFVQILDISENHDSLLKARQQTLQQQVETGYSLIQHFYNLQQQGLSEAEAQKLAGDAIRALRYSGNEYFWVNDSQHKVIIHGSKPESEGKSLGGLQDPNGVYVYREIVITARNHSQGGFVRYDWPKAGSDQPQPKASFVKRFPQWDWIIGSGLYLDDVEQAFQQNLLALLLKSALVLGLLITILLMISSSIRQPLNHVVEALHNISRGEGDLTRRLPIRGNDEITQIARTFNHFVEQIQAVISQVKQSSSRVSSGSQDIASFASSIRQLTNNQLQQNDMAATGSEEMTQTIREVASNAEQAADAARQADDDAKASTLIMQQTQQQISELADDIHHSQQVITQLRNETDGIGSVLDVIRGIAEQTNLLALNAAIEAARAGEQGRGFAVVADEVRTLASRTQESTEEINRMITSLQEQASEAVTAMERSAGSSATTSEKSQQAAETIARIHDAISTISNMNMGIASAVEEQSAAANEINGNIIQVVQSSNDIDQTMDKAESETQALLQSSDQLNTLVERFKI